MGRVGSVFYQGRFAGLLEESDDGFRFTYDRDYLAGGVPISFRLKLRLEPYESAVLMPFFENLLSEGWLRKLQSQQQKIDENDRFGLLLSNGKDMVGAVTVEPVGGP
jgi:serine/threonine-protein kinase HipA